MKHLALSIAALAACATLAGCSGSDAASDEPSAAASTTAAAESPAADSAPAADESAAAGTDSRFTVAYSDVAALMTVISQQSDVNPTSTEEANAAAGLDETTPLVFADYTVLPDEAESTGSLCLLSNSTDTYIAVSYSGAVGEVDLGDGECSYDTANAAVVGDVESNTWTVGGELMGDLLPLAAFGG